MVRSRFRLLVRSGAIVLLAVMVGEIWRRESSCDVDPKILLGGSKTSTCLFFSETYEEARSKFRRAVSEVGAELYTFPVYKDYTMDIGVLKGQLPGVVVHTSGFHGVEGYAGSAIQVAWLSQYSATAKYPTMIFVHAVNPYGMAHYRRTNENNVDLNRNGLHPSEWKKALERDPNIAHYQDFDLNLFNPPRAPTLFDLYARVWFLAARDIYRHGLTALKRAMVTAQYHKETGIFYGGQELQPSLKILWDFLDNHIPQNGTLTMINVHTGLGPSGEDTIVALEGSEIAPQDLSNIFEGSHIPKMDQVGNEMAAGYELIMGSAEGFFDKLCRNTNDWVVSQEFGTLPSVVVGVCLILENAARHFLPDQEAMEWTVLTRRAFYKRTSKWRRDVLTRGLRVLNQAVRRSGT